MPQTFTLDEIDAPKRTFSVDEIDGPTPSPPPGERAGVRGLYSPGREAAGGGPFGIVNRPIDLSGIPTEADLELANQRRFGESEEGLDPLEFLQERPSLSVLQRLRRSDVARRLLGPTAEEREGFLEGAKPYPSPVDIGRKLLEMTTVPPPIAEPARELVAHGVKDLPAPAAGVVQGVSELALGTPVALPVGGRAVSAGFALDMASQAPELKEQFDAAVREGNTEEAWRLGTAGVLTPLLAAGAATHALRRTPSKAEAGGKVTAEMLREATETAEDLQARGEQVFPELPAAEPRTFTIEEVDNPPMRSVGPVRILNGAGQIVDVMPAERTELRPPEQPATVPEPSAAETITGREGRTGPEMPAEREERPRRTAPSAERPHDLIDELEGSVGKIDPALIREADPHWKPIGAARKLFRRGGRPADTALNAITYEGPKLGLAQDTPLDAFGEALNAAARARKEFRGAERRYEQRAVLEGKQEEQFRKRVLQGERPKAQAENVEQVPVEGLVEGDTFKVQEHEFTVRKLEFDEDANLTGILVKDGPKFGVQTIRPGQEIIHIDKGTFEPVPREQWPTVEPEPTAPGFQLDKPESVAEQEARFAAEAEKRMAAERAAAMAEAQAKPLVGSVGDIGQADLLGGGDLFSAPAPRPRAGGPGTQGMAEALELISKLPLSKPEQIPPRPGADPKFVGRWVFGAGRAATSLMYERADGTRLTAKDERSIAEHGPGPPGRPFVRRTWATEAEALAAQKELLEPKPGIVSNTAAEAWADRTIAEGRKRLHAGLDPELLAAYVVKGAAVIERGARKFADWAAKMIASEGEGIRPHLREIWEQAQRTARNVEPLINANRRESKFAARAQVAPEVLTEHQKRMAGEAGLYEPQAMDDVSALVKSLSNEQLRQIPQLTEAGPNNAWVAAKVELYNRLKNANSEEAWGHLEEARQQLTTFGQLVNQAKLLTSATPEGIVGAIEHDRRRKKLPPLEPADKGELVILADKTIESQKDLEKAETEYGRNPTDENVSKVEKARREADAAQRLLEEKKRGAEPRGLADTLIQVMQGNVLAPISHVYNVGGNIFSALARGSERSGALLGDLFWSFVRGRPREFYINPARTAPQQFASLKRSWQDMKRIWTHGASDLDPSKLDTRRSLHPLLALRDIKAGKWKGQKLGEKAALALEASPFAMHAAAQLRLLGVGDVPFRQAARARLITEAMKVRRMNAQRELAALTKAPLQQRDLSTRVRIAGLRRFLSGPDRTAHAVRIPERFFGSEEMARIDLESQRVTFQEPNPVARWLLSGARKLPAPLRLFLRANGLFITTPLNIIKQVYQFNPAIAGASFLRHAAKGNTREAKLAFGRLLTGSIVAGTGYVLARSGLLSPPLDDPSEAQKGRMLSEATMPANHLNLSGIQRAAAGGDPTWQAGDRTVDISKLGVMGILMMQAAHVARQQERKPEAAGALGFAGDLLTESSLGAAQYGLQQSFLRNMESVLHAVSTGEAGAIDSWAQAFSDTAMSVPFPNTLTAFSRASRQWKPEVRGDSFDVRLNNIIKNRLDFAMPGPANLPLRRGLWGEPLAETPEGATPWLYQFLDITKGRTVPEDPVNLTLYTLWRQTADAGVIPTPPDRRITVDQETIPLTREQHSRLQELVGKARREIASEVVTSPDFLRLSKEEKIAELKDIWREGSSEGTEMFVDEREAELTRKPKPSGLPLNR